MSRYATEGRDLAILATKILPRGAGHNFALKIQAALEAAHLAGRREALVEAAKVCEGNGHEWHLSDPPNRAPIWACIRCGDLTTGDRIAPSESIVGTPDVIERRISRRHHRATYRGDPPRVGPERSPLPGQHWHGGIPDAARWVR